MSSAEFEQYGERIARALESGEAALAVELSGRCVDAEPDNPVFRCWRAEALSAAGRGAEAIEQARRAVACGPGLHEARFVLAEVARRLGRMAEAQQALEEAIIVSGRDPAAMTEYALFMAAERGPRLAEGAALAAVEAAPQSADAWTALGIAKFRLHRLAEAESALRRAIELDGGSELTRSNLAAVLAAARRADEAGP